MTLAFQRSNAYKQGESFLNFITLHNGRRATPLFQVPFLVTKHPPSWEFPPPLLSKRLSPRHVRSDTREYSWHAQASGRPSGPLSRTEHPCGACSLLPSRTEHPCGACPLLIASFPGRARVDIHPHALEPADVVSASAACGRL
jgi:hypothetical protein